MVSGPSGPAVSDANKDRKKAIDEKKINFLDLIMI